MKDHLQSNKTEPPKLVAFKDSGEDEMKKIFVVSHGTYVAVTSAKPNDAFLTLFGVYYIINGQYPKCYNGVMGFLQQYWLQESSYDGWKSSKYCLLEPRVKKILADQAKRD